MVCRYCGKEISRDALFCPHCKRSTYYSSGRPEPDCQDNDRYSQGEKAASHSTAKPAAPKKKAAVRKWIGRVLCLLLILCGMLAYMSYGTIVKIPDPSQFLGISDPGYGNSGIGTHKHAVTVKSPQPFLSDVQEYTEHLEDRCHLEVTWHSEKPYEMLGIQYLERYVLEYDGFWVPPVSRPSLSVQYYTNDSGSYYCTVHYDRTVGLKDHTGSRTQSSQTVQLETRPQEVSARQEEAAPAVDQLPSFLSTAKNDGFYIDSFYADNSYSHEIHYNTKTQNNFDVVQQYVDILTDAHDCRIVHHYSKSGKDWGSETWYLEHPCAEATPREIGNDTGIEGNIWISYMEVDDMHSALTIQYVTPLEHMDTDGMDSKTESSGSSGSSTSGSSSSTLPRIQVDCTKCHGDKKIDCTNCNGVGYKIKRESVANYSGSTAGSRWAETKEDCFKCDGGKVDCDRCGGSGKEK